jgi:hypothetical protein
MSGQFKEKDDYASATINELGPTRSQVSLNEKDLSKDETWPVTSTELGYSESDGTVAAASRVTGQDLEEAEEFAKTLTMEEVREVSLPAPSLIFCTSC